MRYFECLIGTVRGGQGPDLTGPKQYLSTVLAEYSVDKSVDASAKRL
jgi:hypothetical protein